MVPTLQPSTRCTNLVLNGGPLDLPKLHPYGRIDRRQIMTDVDNITIVDAAYCNWLLHKYQINPQVSYGIVKPTVQSMTIQVAKFAEPVHGKPDPELFKLADDALRIVLSDLKGSCKFTPFEEVELNMEATCGYPIATLYKDKGNAVIGQHQTLKWWVTEGWRKDAPQYSKLTGKVERLTLDEIEKQKCRAFQPDPIQIILFEAQLNQDMIRKFKDLRGTFSAYGFNKWDGGWNALFKRFDNFDHFFAGDVERWDKHYQPYHHDANTEMKKTFIDPEQRKFYDTDARFDYINTHAKHLHLLLWTGDIVKLEQGQGSGRYTTTFDNILTHMRIMFYHYYRVRREYGLDLPTKPWEIREFFDAYVFGDDSCGATTNEKLADFDERQTSYNQCGFRLKKSDDFHQQQINGMPFLGAKVGTYKGKYVFLMDPDRVHGSLTALSRHMTQMERFERTFQIFMNCVFTEANYPGLDVPVWRVLYERVKYLQRELPNSDLGAYGTIFSLDVYRNMVLGLECLDKGAEEQLKRSNCAFFTVTGQCTTTPIGENLPGQSRDIKLGAKQSNSECPKTSKSSPPL